MTDFGGTLLLKLRMWRLQMLSLCSTFQMKVSLSVRGINYGNNIRFWGSAYILRFPRSSIFIGNSVSFRSDKTSNLIGVNRKCIVATHSNEATIKIGNNCGLSGTVIGARQSIVLGNDVICGANTLITDFDWHGIQLDKRRSSSGDSKEVVIGNNVFIGYGSVVLKGVTIGDNSVIGANSVVSRNIPDNVIAAGNPCKVIKSLPQ